MRRIRRSWRPGRRRHKRRFSPIFDWLLAIAVLAALVLVVARMQDGGNFEMTGIARVIDGDTMEIGGERIRLYGIDAPESGQSCRLNGAHYACGQRARDELAAIGSEAPMRCAGGERDRYSRLLMRCSIKGEEINRKLVEMGWAVSYGAYRNAERAAREAKRGLWAGEFERPSDWRVVNGMLIDDEHGGFAALWRHFKAIVIGNGENQ